MHKGGRKSGERGGGEHRGKARERDDTEGGGDERQRGERESSDSDIV